MTRVADITLSDKLLSWYDRSARDLPWRVSPADRAAGVAPDPYRVWLSEVMLQQTTVATVTPRFGAFLERWPTVAALASASEDDVLAAWAGLGYYARARNMHACAQQVARDFGGEFPTTEEALLALPGVGPYTAAAIAAIAFDHPAVVVDGNIERVASRLFMIESPVRDAKDEIKRRLAGVWPDQRSGDFAQGLMDLGAVVCTPTNPSCLICPIHEHCRAARDGDPARFPIKPKRAPKPERSGVAYALFDARGRVLLEKRPSKGLLGGMLALPSAGWSAVDSDPPADVEWEDAGVVEHVFTHFRLRLSVYVADAPKGRRAKSGERWLDPEAAPAPTVMRKAIDLAARSRQNSSAA
ncbi:MAG: A/G-specific adenine glycosylase [Pseudomonadota bacterium]